jgi:hypothetical protein
LHLLGVVGLGRALADRDRDGFLRLLLGSVLLFLFVFSTSVPVYDGERLFLMVFPLWAVFVGRGFGIVWERLIGLRWARAALAGIVLAQGFGLVSTYPFGLSYYNALVGGLPGAERLGLELTFWGDAIDPALLGALVREVPSEAEVVLVPTLYPGQGIASTTRAMARSSILLRDEEFTATAPWLVISRRTAYWRPEVRDGLARGRIVFENKRQGVWLSAIVAIAPRGPSDRAQAPDQHSSTAEPPGGSSSTTARARGLRSAEEGSKPFTPRDE